MFSGLLRFTILAIAALTGLLMLCIPIARADSTPVMSIYMSNAGLYLSFGVSNSPETLYEKSLSTWESSALFGHPPSLALNDSPLIAFQHMIREVAPAIRNQIEQHELNDRPLKVYIAAAGADRASWLPLPTGAAVINHLSKDQMEFCYAPGTNRKDFFRCAFQYEILQGILQSNDSKLVQLSLEQDHHLITTMANIYSGQKSANQDSIVVHSTTISQPYLVKNGSAVELGGWVPSTMRKHGGIYQIGQLLQQYLQAHRDSDPLRYVLERDTMVANHPQGAQANIKRLEQHSKGYNNFGHVIGETANTWNQQRIHFDSKTPQDNIYAQARQAALPMLSRARKDFISLSLLLYAIEEHRFEGLTPQLIIVGEEAEIMFASEQLFRTVARNLLSPNPAISLPDVIYTKRPDLKAEEQRQNWLKTKGRRLLDKATILPVNQFARLQHQSAVLKTQ